MEAPGDGLLIIIIIIIIIVIVIIVIVIVIVISVITIINKIYPSKLLLTLKSASSNFHNSASTALIDDYHKTLLDIINCQKLGFRWKSVV